MYLPNVEYCHEGDAVICNGSNAIGIVTSVSLSRGLAWVLWPAGSGIDQCVSVNILSTVAPAQQVLAALQVIATAQQLDSPLARSFLNSAQGRASSAIVEYDDNRARVTYNPKGNQYLR